MAGEFVSEASDLYLKPCYMGPGTLMTKSVLNPPSAKYRCIGTLPNQYKLLHIQTPHEESLHSSTNMSSLK